MNYLIFFTVHGNDGLTFATLDELGSKIAKHLSLGHRVGSVQPIPSITTHEQAERTE